MKPVIISHEAIKRVVQDEMMRAYGDPPMHPYASAFPTLPQPVRTPRSQAELLNLLDPEAPEFNTPFGVFSKLSVTERRTLGELAQQIREAETPEDRFTATEGMRAALTAFKFPDEWIDTVCPRQREPKFKSRERLPEGEKTRGAGWPMNRQYHESNCRFFSQSESDADGNQGSFTE